MVKELFEMFPTQNILYDLPQRGNVWCNIDYYYTVHKCVYILIYQY